MTRSEVVRLFEGINCARIGDGFAPHKPIVVLLLLEMLAVGHENRFAYREFDQSLRRLLEKYGSPSAAGARSEPFWRLPNDGVFAVSSVYSALIDSRRTPTPTQLLEHDAVVTMPDELYHMLRFTPGLINDVAQAVAMTFLPAKTRRAIVVGAAPTIAKERRKYWWVSQNRTYREEVGGDFMWSPQTNTDGSSNVNYDFMREIVPGDVVFSFSESQIKAIGVVKQGAVASPKPTTFGPRGNHWLDNGWLVEVAFYTLGPAAMRPSDHMALIAPTLPSRYAPIRPNGIGNQIYLAPVPRNMASVMFALIGPLSDALVDRASAVLLLEEATIGDDDALDAIASRTDIGETQKQQLILARRGQGLFRTGVYQVELRCRLTHVSEKIHLVASHIKPWASSSDEERLDRFNGLLLSPHADHLFDRGWLSFTNSGNVIVSKRLDHQVLAYWNLDPGMNVGPFHREQQAFLDYHRDAVLIH